MAWETRANGQRYFYLSRRFCGRVVKEYYGSGPEAELAAEMVEARKQARQVDREKVNAAKAGLKLVERQMEQLRRAPLDEIHAESTDKQPDDSASAQPLPTPQTVLTRARELLSARQAGDPTAEAELTDLIDRFPNLMHRFGDLAGLARAKWMTLMVGNDPVFRRASIQKLEDLRSQFPISDNPVSRLLVERILTTWLQLSFAESKMAETNPQNRSSSEFYSRLQHRAQRQHMQAIRAWSQWQGATRCGNDTLKSA